MTKDFGRIREKEIERVVYIYIYIYMCVCVCENLERLTFRQCKEKPVI